MVAIGSHVTKGSAMGRPLCINGVNEMPQNNDNGSWNGFANIRLESQHQKAIKALAGTMTGDDVLAYILECVDDGYAVSVSPDFEHDAIIVTLTGKGDDNVNCGYAMSQRHSDPIVALAASKFAHEELAQRELWVKFQYDWRDVSW